MTPHLVIESARLAGSPRLRTESDDRLVDLVRAGNDRAFEAIVERYRRPLLRYCTRMLPLGRAEDAVQQTFLNAYAAMRDGDAELDLRPWLYRISRNACLNALRENGWSHEQIEDVRRGAESAHDAVERRQELREVVAAVHMLPDRQREAMVLRELEGRSYDQIAAQLDATDGAVRQLLNRARNTLRTGVSALTPLGGLAEAPRVLGAGEGLLGRGEGVTQVPVAAAPSASVPAARSPEIGSPLPSPFQPDVLKGPGPGSRGPSATRPTTAPTAAGGDPSRGRDPSHDLVPPRASMGLGAAPAATPRQVPRLGPHGGSGLGGVLEKVGERTSAATQSATQIVAPVLGQQERSDGGRAREQRSASVTHVLARILFVSDDKTGTTLPTPTSADAPEPEPASAAGGPADASDEPGEPGEPGEDPAEAAADERATAKADPPASASPAGDAIEQTGEAGKGDRRHNRGEQSEGRDGRSGRKGH